MDEVDTTGNGNAIVVVEVPVDGNALTIGGCGRGSSRGSETTHQGAVDRVDGDRRTSGHIDEADLGLELAGGLVGGIVVVGIGNYIDETQDGVAVAVSASRGTGLTSESGDVVANLELIHRVVVVLLDATGEE